jgi:hypothetical protein
MHPAEPDEVVEGGVGDLSLQAGQARHLRPARSARFESGQDLAQRPRAGLLTSRCTTGRKVG